MDVFVLVKRAKNGKRFGFVRFKGVRDLEGLWGRLIEIRVGEHIIFIKPALFHKLNGSTLRIDIEKAEKVRQAGLLGSSSKEVPVITMTHGSKTYLNLLVEWLATQVSRENLKS